MLNKEQLQDASDCMGKLCYECKVDINTKAVSSCVMTTARTALELMEENEKLKLMLKKCDPISMSTLRCMFCDKFYLWGHTQDCKYRKAVENV